MSKFYDSFRGAYAKARGITEKKVLPKVYNYYIEQFTKITKRFLETGSYNPIGFFQQKFITDLYAYIYINTGMYFVLWYADNFRKYTNKQINPELYLQEWEATFKWYSIQMAEVWGPEITRTATKSAIRTFEALMKDPEFAMLGVEQKAKILSRKHEHIGMVNSKRIITTETTRISNYALEQSATTLFDAQYLKKYWIASIDGAERSSHNVAHYKYQDGIPMKEKYNVGGEMLDRPGAGYLAENNINCRCVSVALPVPDAEANVELDSFGFGMAGGKTTNWY